MADLSSGPPAHVDVSSDSDEDKDKASWRVLFFGALIGTILLLLIGVVFGVVFCCPDKPEPHASTTPTTKEDKPVHLQAALYRDVLSKVAQSRITPQQLQTSLIDRQGEHINVITHAPDLEVAIFPCDSTGLDNYGYLVKSGGSLDQGPLVLAIDVPDGQRYLDVSQTLGWQPLTHILLTHNHDDHVRGVPKLRSTFPQVEILAGEIEKYGFSLTGTFGEGETKTLSGPASGLLQGGTSSRSPLNVRALHTPGHSPGHLAFVFPEYDLAFTGDALFAMGCGRVNAPGTYAEMDHSLTSILKTALPKNCLVYGGHEYTKKNGLFALSVDASNTVLQERMKGVTFAVDQNRPTMPTLMELELLTNPFLRPAELGTSFEVLRKAKDKF